MRFEYAHVVHFETGNGVSVASFFPLGKEMTLQSAPPHELLNAVAAEGWELVSVTSESGNEALWTHFWLKREVR